MQLLLGGVFQTLTFYFICAELVFELDWYPKYLCATTSKELPFDSLIYVTYKILNLIQAFQISNTPVVGREIRRSYDKMFLIAFNCRAAERQYVGFIKVIFPAEEILQDKEAGTREEYLKRLR